MAVREGIFMLLIYYAVLFSALDYTGYSQIILLVFLALNIVNIFN